MNKPFWTNKVGNLLVCNICVKINVYLNHLLLIKFRTLVNTNTEPEEITNNLQETFGYFLSNSICTKLTYKTIIYLRGKLMRLSPLLNLNQNIKLS